MSTSIINRPMRRRNMYLILVLILLLEVGLFAWSFLSKTNITKTATQYLPIGSLMPTFQANIYGDLSDPFNKPMAVAVSNRTIYISDTNNQRIQVFDYDGKPISMFGEPGEGEGQFRFPYGIASDAQGQLYIADLYNGNISIFSANGQFIKYFGEKGEFKGPAGLAIDGDKLYVSDVQSSEIKIFSLDGTKLLSFGKKGAGDGELNSPNALVHAGNKIYVSDTGNDRIQVFDEQGNFLLKASSQLSNPRGISVDPQGNIYVVSNLTNKVVVFKPNGEKLTTIGQMGSDDGQFRFPNGLTRDNQGRLYITDVGNGRTAIFQ